MSSSRHIFRYGIGTGTSKKRKRSSTSFLSRSLQEELRRNRRPLIGGRLVTRAISRNCYESHYKKLLSYFRNFSFNGLRRLKSSLDGFGCKNCTNNIMKIACYLRAHLYEHPNTLGVCYWIMREGLTLEGNAIYEDYPRVRSHIYEKKNLLKVPLDEEEENNPLFKLEKESVKYSFWGKKMNTRDFPAYSVFPIIDEEKESKMYLCYEATPNEAQVSKFEARVKDFVTKYGPQILPNVPTDAAVSFGSSFYYDSGVIRKDFEKPNRWNGRFKYQAFWTSPGTKREVWLPSKAYKTWSSYWHQMAYPILNNCKYTIVNETVTEIRKGLFSKDFNTPSMRKIDLKGFGLQYPREYVLSVAKVMTEIYGLEPDNVDRLKYVFDNISIERDDGSTEHPLRGVGLGYFTNLMVIGIAAQLDDLDVRKMFSDDILINASNYQIARDRLTSLGFIINEKKTGELWQKCAYFAGTTMTRAGSLRHWDAQAHLGAAFNTELHYIRKEILSNLDLNNRQGVLLTYLRTFGYEYDKGEIFEHPTKLGANPEALHVWGTVKGGLLRTLRSPKDVREDNLLPHYLAYPWKREKRYDLAAEREKLSLKYSHMVHDNTYDVLLDPRVIERNVYNSVLDIFLGSFQLPKWADVYMLLTQGKTSGRTTAGLNREHSMNAILKYPLSKDPFQTAKMGGYELDIAFDIDHLPREEMINLYYAISKAKYIDNEFFWKERPKTTPQDKNVVQVVYPHIDLRAATVKEEPLGFDLNYQELEFSPEEEDGPIEGYDPTEFLSPEEMEGLDPAYGDQDDDDWE